MNKKQNEALLAQQAQEIERLRAELEQAQEKLHDRQIVTERAGTMAQAAMELSGIFKAADEAAAQYLENIRQFADEQRKNCEQIERTTQARAEAMLRETEERCKRREKEADAYWEKVSEKLAQYCSEHRELRGLLEEGREKMRPADDRKD